MRNPGLLAAFALSTLLVACSGNVGGGPEERLGRQASAVQGGATDTANAHNFAVGVANRLGGVCSGTLIAPNLILTARHCVVPPTADDAVNCSDTFGKNVDPGALFVTTEPNLYKAKNYYASSEILTPASSAFCGNDIALIILEKSIPASEAEPAIPVVQFSMTDARLAGSITAMGYGITNPSADDSGQRRIRENIPLLCIPGSKSMDCTGDNAKFSHDPSEFVTEGYVCSGDSGGGAFDQGSFDKGTPYVLGALSRGPQTKDRCLAAIYSRTDAHAKLIIDAAIKAAAKGKYAAPPWTLTAPGAPAPQDNAPPCDGDTCTDTSATEPSSSEPKASKTAANGCSASGISGRNGSSGLALAGLVLAGVLAARRRRAV